MMSPLLKLLFSLLSISCGSPHIGDFSPSLETSMGSDLFASDSGNSRPLRVDPKTRMLLDTTNQNVVLRGIQVPLAFRATQEASLDQAVLQKISDYGFNMVRVTWSSVASEEFNIDTSVLLRFLNEASKQNLIVMLEAHNVPGRNDAADLDKVVQYWVTLRKDIAPYERFLMLNIANEWGSNALDKNGYKVAYVQAIRKLREAGYRIPLVIDTGGWGQNITYLTAALDGTKKPTWQHLIETDHTLTGQANLMFGLHLYGDWHMKRGEQGAKYGLFDDLIPLSKIAPLLVGEFGWASKDNPDNAKMTVAAIIKEIYLHNLHANVYSWGGNNPYFRTPGKVGPLRNYSYLDFVPSAYTYGPNLPDGPQVQKYTFKNNELTSFGKQLITKENKLAIARPKARFSPAP